MQMRLTFVAIVLLIVVAAQAPAARYVAQANQTPNPPYDGWSNAASNIQDAVNAAAVNETVWIGAGHYKVPPNATNYWGTNVVYINRPMTLRGATGNPEDVTIDGKGKYRGAAVNYITTTSDRFVFDSITFSNGFATNRGGGLVMQHADAAWTAELRNCVFTHNSSRYRGGAIASSETINPRNFALRATNSVFRNNQTIDSGGAIYLSGLGETRISRCLFEYNKAGSSGAMYMWYYNGSYIVEDCVIRYNAATNGGGGAMSLLASNYRLRNCLIHDNRGTGSSYGGAIPVFQRAYVDMDNCTIVSNRSGGSSVGVINCYSYGQARRLTVRNSIIQHNWPFSLSVDNYTDVSFTNTCIASTNGLPGQGNFTNAPAFAAFAAKDFRLTRASPCVNAGYYQAWMDNALDLDGNARIDRVYKHVDVGCYEYPFVGTSILIR